MSKTITIYIAAQGARTTSYADAPHGDRSGAGHMWIKADDSNDSDPPRYAGFAPEKRRFSKSRQQRT